MLTSEDFIFFSVLAKAKNLADAARTLDVTPPAVSQRLQALEVRAGVRLVDRTSRTLSLTEEGMFLAEHSLGVLRDIDAITETLTSRAGVVSGHLRILAPFGFGRRYVSPVVAEFNKAYPDTTIDLRLSEDPIHSSHDTSDVIIHIGDLKDSSRQMVKLASNRRLLSASPSYLAKYGTPNSPGELRDFKCAVVRENDEDVTLWRLTHGDGRSISVRVRPTIASNDGEIIRSWALDGLGIVLRSEWSIAGDLQHGSLIRLLPDWNAENADIVALFPSRQGRVARTVRFIEFLKAHLALPPWRIESPVQHRSPDERLAAP